MDVWFVRSNATPVHNDPLHRRDDYVPGEPHVRAEENYLENCLVGGFARIGWPNTGPLQPGFDSERFPDFLSVLLCVAMPLKASNHITKAI